MERYLLQRYSPYKYAVIKHDSTKVGDLHWENYKSSTDKKNNNRHLMVEMDKVNKKGRPQKRYTMCIQLNLETSISPGIAKITLGVRKLTHPKGFIHDISIKI